jgi:hypothetical protein
MTLGLVREASRRPELTESPSSDGTLPEWVLRRAYALSTPDPRVAPCACGAWVDATSLTILAAVGIHNETLEHRAWRAVREAE